MSTEPEIFHAPFQILLAHPLLFPPSSTVAAVASTSVQLHTAWQHLSSCEPPGSTWGPPCWGCCWTALTVQFSSVTQSCPTLCDATDCSTPGLPVHHLSIWSLLKLMSIESVMPSSHLILCRPLLLLPSIFPSIRVFPNESALCIRWPKCWSFSFSIRPSNEYSGLISFRMNWLNLRELQGTLKSLLQQHSSKTSVLQHSAFLTDPLSHPYMTGKTIALTT